MLHKLYTSVFRRTSSFVLAIMVGTIFFERTLNRSSELIFSAYNKGKLYSDIAPKYAQIRGEE